MRMRMMAVLALVLAAAGGAVAPAPPAVAATGTGTGTGAGMGTVAGTGTGTVAGTGTGTTGTGTGAARWSWPLAPPHVIARPYLAPPTPYGAGHRGIDIRAPAGTLVLAPDDGIVHFAGVVVDRPVVSIAHADGVLSSVEPVTTTLHAGEAVRRGEVIGTLSAGHCDASACLHLGARIHGRYVNPLVFLGGVPRAVLYPTRAVAGGVAPVGPGGSAGGRLGLVQLGLVQLRHAQLRHAQLRHAQLRHAQLRHAQLRHAQLRHVQLGRGRLGSGRLRLADGRWRMPT